MTQLAERLGFDLADALAGDIEILANLFKRVFAVDANTKAFTQHFFLARREGLQNFERLLLEIQFHRRL